MCSLWTGSSKTWTGNWRFSLWSDTIAVAVWSKTDVFDVTKWTSVFPLSVSVVCGIGDSNFWQMVVWWFWHLHEKHLPSFGHDLMECPGYKHVNHEQFFHTTSFRLSKSVTTVHLSEKWVCLQNEHFNTRDPVVKR